MPRPLAWARIRAVAAVVAAAVLASAPSSLLCQREPQREAPEVRKLVLNGVHGVSSYDLGRSISTTASQCKNLLLFAFCAVSKSPTFIDKHYLDRDEFRRDVLRIRVFYWKRGYRDATVDTSVTRFGPGSVKVVF